MYDKKIIKNGLIVFGALFTTFALMIREKMIIDFSQHLMISLIFCISILSYYRIFNTCEKMPKSTVVLSVVLSIFKFCQLTVETNSEFIYFFRYLEKSPIASTIAIIGYSFLYYAIISVLYMLFNKIKEINITKKLKKTTELIFDEHPVKLTMAILFLLWIPHIIIQYPGVVAGDTDAEIAKFLWMGGEIFSSHFPVFHIWLEGTIISAAKNILGSTNLGFFFFTVLNFSLAIAVFANTFRLMKELKTPMLYRIICLGIYGILPAFVGHIIINVKDTLYALGFVLLVTTLIKLQINESHFWNNKKEWILYILAGCIIILTRNNGIHIMAVVSITLLIKIIILKTQALKKLIITATPIIISITIIQIITVCYNVLPGEKAEMYSFFIQQTARYIYFNKEKITKEEEDVLRKTLGYDEIEERYNPILSDLVKDTFTDLTTDYIKVYIGQFIKDPKVYIDATLNMIYKLFVPDIIISDYQDVFESGFPVRFEEEQIEVLRYPRFLLYRYYDLYERFPITNILTSYGTYNCLVLIIMVFLIKDNRKKELFIYVPIIATIGILILSPVACFRYCMPIVFSTPILLGHYIRKE